MFNQLCRATLVAFAVIANLHPKLEVTLVELDPPTKQNPNDACVTVQYGGNIIVQARMVRIVETQVEL